MINSSAENFFAAGPPQGKKRPLGGQQAEGAAWGVLFGRSFRSMMNQGGECIHVAAIYLGIAVLVTTALSLTVPSLRIQSRNMHDALVATLRPDVMQGGSSDTSYASYAQASDALLAAAMGPAASVSAVPEPAPEAAAAQAVPPAAAPQASTAQMGTIQKGAAISSTSTKNAAGGAQVASAVNVTNTVNTVNSANNANTASGPNAAVVPVVGGGAVAAPEHKAGVPVHPKENAKVELVSSSSFSRALGIAAEDLSIPHVSKAQAEALRSYIARKYQIAYNAAGMLIKTAFVVGKEQHLDPQLLLAVIAVESRYNPFAESHVGAQGLMQVMTNVHKDKFARFGGGLAAALNPIANIRVGSQILKDCIKRRGTVLGGLACYVGSTGTNDGGYGVRVLAEQRRIALASGIPIDK